MNTLAGAVRVKKVYDINDFQQIFVIFNYRNGSVYKQG